MEETQYPHLPTCIEPVNRIMEDIVDSSFVADQGYGCIDVVRLEDVLMALCREFDVKPSETNFENYGK